MWFHSVLKNLNSFSAGRVIVFGHQNAFSMTMPPTCGSYRHTSLSCSPWLFPVQSKVLPLTCSTSPNLSCKHKDSHHHSSQTTCRHHRMQWRKEVHGRVRWCGTVTVRIQMDVRAYVTPGRWTVTTGVPLLQNRQHQFHKYSVLGFLFHKWWKSYFLF